MNRRELARALRASGLTWAQVGAQLGVSGSRALRIARGMRRPGNPHTKPEPPRSAERTREVIATICSIHARCAMCGGNRETCGHFVGGGAL